MVKIYVKASCSLEKIVSDFFFLMRYSDKLNNRLLMIVCIPHYSIHSRVGQRLTGERMIRLAGEWKSVFHVLYEKLFNEGVL